MDNNKIRLKFNHKLKKINPLSRHKYIYFKLFKSNIDTMSAIFKLHKITGISQKIFSTAGLKDKRGITTQMVSVWNSDINSLKRFYEMADRNKEIWI
jgi:tRNA(Glu) U13 pseudouridine synthase TruD